MKLKIFIITSVLLASSSLVFASSGCDFKITDPNLGHEIFTKALNDHDIDKLVALYADDAVMVAPGNKVINGKKDIRAFFEEIVPVIKKISLDTVFRINYKDTIVFRSKYTLIYKTPDGKTETQSTSGIEVVQKQVDGSWLFIVDHHYGGSDYLDFKKLNMKK